MNDVAHMNPPAVVGDRPKAGEGRVLGVDLGRRRIGLAISDSGRLVASALSVLARGASHVEDHAHLASVVAETGANQVVVGLPLSLSGRAGPAAEAVENEVAELRRALSVPVDVSDERFSTVVAERSLIAGGRKAPARRKVVDKVAAAGILQTWLDRQRSARPAKGQGRASGSSTVPQGGLDSPAGGLGG
jgi:putative holliday junction resolvase